MAQIQNKDLPLNLYERLRQTLAQANSLLSEEQVELLFSHPLLLPWQQQLAFPRGNFTMRIRYLLSFLTPLYHEQQQQSVLVIFLRVLAEEIPIEDTRRNQIVQLAEDIEEHLQKSSLANEYNLQLSTQITQQDLRQKLIKHFNINELKDICFDLNIDYELLSGNNKADIVRELILHLDNRGRLGELVAIIRRERANII